MNLDCKEYTLEEIAKLIPSGFSNKKIQARRDELVQNILNDKNIANSVTLNDDTIFNIFNVAYRKYFNYVLEHGDTWVYNQGKSYTLLSAITCLYDLIYKSKNN